MVDRREIPTDPSDFVSGLSAQKPDPDVVIRPEGFNQIVHLVDDDELLQIAMTRLLKFAGFEARTYASAVDFLSARDASFRGCLILDVNMPGGLSGLDLQQELIRQQDWMPVIFLTGCGDISMSVKAMKAGAFDFLTKPASSEVLVPTVEAALIKESEIWNQHLNRRNVIRSAESLTPCEQNVYVRLIAGLTNVQIGQEIGSAVRTVKMHRASVLKKMGVSSVAQLVSLVCRLQDGRMRG